MTPPPPPPGAPASRPPWPALAFLIGLLALDLALGRWTGAAVPPPRPAPPSPAWPARAWQARVADLASAPGNPLGLTPPEKVEVAGHLRELARSGRELLAVSSALEALMGADGRAESSRLDRDLPQRAVLLRRPLTALAREAMQALEEEPGAAGGTLSQAPAPGAREADPARTLAVLIRLQGDPARDLRGADAVQAGLLVRQGLRAAAKHEEAWARLARRAGPPPAEPPPAEEVPLAEAADRADQAARTLEEEGS